MNNADFQPSCREVREKDLVDVDRDYIKAGKILPGCSHKRAFKYFIESVESMDCKFLGIKCRSYHEYLEVITFDLKDWNFFAKSKTC